MPVSGKPRWLPLAAAALIVLAALAAYADSFRVPFVFDDGPSIPENATIRHLWPLSGPLSPPRGQGITVEGRPILNLSLAVNYAISGTHVWSYHAVNLLIHILAGLTLFGIVRRTLELLESSPICKNRAGITEPPDEPPHSYECSYMALTVALLWTVHPLQTESVTYVIQRAESLIGLFYLLTLYCFIRYADKKAGRYTWGVLSVLACFFGMATKEVMVSAPLAVLLYDRAFVAGCFREAWRRRGRYYLALAAAWLLLIALVASAGNRGGTSGMGSGIGAGTYWLTQFEAVVRYLRLSVWPHPLIFDYGTEWVGNLGSVIPYALCVAALGAAAIWALVRSPKLGFLGFWFFAILAPTSLVPGNRQTLAEHRMYLPLAAVIALLVIGGSRVAAFVKMRTNLRIFTNAATLILVALCCFLTARRNQDYRTPLALYADTVAKRPGNAFARYNLGKALDESGQPERAVPEYVQAVRLRPDLVNPHINLGNSLAKLGRLREAAAEYEAALRLKPDVADAEYDLGNALVGQGLKSEAVAHFQAALRIDPHYGDARDNLGSVFLDLGRLDEAIEQYRSNLRFDPNLSSTHFNLGTAYRLQGRRAEAIEQYEIALRLDPGFTPARRALAELE